MVTEEEVDADYAKAIKAIEDLELKNMLRQKEDPMDCVLKINSGAGGTESQDWAQMLMRMYMRWAEAHGYKVTITDMQEGDEAGIKRRTEGKDTVSLVILLLFAYKEEANLRIINHILNLLLAAVGIEWHSSNSDTIRTEVGVQIMHTVLRKDSNFVKRFSPKIQEGIAHLFHS